MKRFLLKTVALAISSIILATSVGCQFTGSDVLTNNKSKKFSDKNTKYNDINTINATTPYTETTLDYGYSVLSNDTEKNLYNEFEYIVTSVSDTPEEDGLYAMDTIEISDSNLSEGSIRKVIEAFNCDHPEIFWISNTFGYYTDSSVTMVHLYSEFSCKQINSMQTELNIAVNGFLEDIPEGLDEYTLEKTIHDKLLKSCSYANNVSSSKDNPNAFTMYGALVEDSAVCEGYTKTMQYLLKMVGIKTITVNGYSKNELHQWCLVNINGDWYHLDATWNDKNYNIESDNNNPVNYLYFNVNDDYIQADHKLAKDCTKMTEDELCGNDEDKTQIFNLPLPKCSSEVNSFYNTIGATLTGITDYESYNNIVMKLLSVAEAKDENFYIKVDDKLDYQKTVDSLFNNQPYEFFEYTADVNNSLDGYKISDSLSMLTLEKQRIIQVGLKYE